MLYLKTKLGGVKKYAKNKLFFHVNRSLPRYRHFNGFLSHLDKIKHIFIIHRNNSTIIHIHTNSFNLICSPKRTSVLDPLKNVDLYQQDFLR